MRWMVLCLVWMVSADALAWGRTGHRITGELAERKLEPAVRAEVQRLLAVGGETSLAEATLWADAVRETDPGYRWSTPLHWVNFERGQCVYQPELCANGNCVVAAIERYTAALADRSLSDAERAIALKFLVHFIGDVHQPLHAGYAVDRGGNDFQISFQRLGWNLHSVWDTLILESLELHWSSYADRIAALPPNAAASEVSPRRWAEESCQIVQRDDFYPPKHKITRKYLDTMRPIADERLKLATDRLAATLNRVLAP
jgi:hypothetical protein